MKQINLVMGIVCLVLPTICYSQKLAVSIDKYPQQQFVTVAPNVKLEVLDWGGPGRNLVLLAGGGDTAHVRGRRGPARQSAHLKIRPLIYR